MNFGKAMLVAGAMLAVMSAHAAHTFEAKGTNAWFEAENWSAKTLPTTSTEVVFPADAGVITLDGGDAQSKSLSLAAASGVTNNADGINGTVVVKGPGTLSKTASMRVGFGRRLIFDNVTRPDGLDYIIPSGELVLRNGCAWKTDTTKGSYSSVAADSRLILDGSTLCMNSVSHDAGTNDGVIRIVNGGTFEYLNDYSNCGVNFQVELIDGSFITHRGQSYNFIMASAFPRRPEGKLIVRGNVEVTALCPALTDGQKVRFDGDVYVTNYTAQGTAITNNSTFYGRGRLYTGGLRLWSGKNSGSTAADCPDVTFAVSALYNRGTYGIRGTDYASIYRYPHDITLGAIGNWSSSGLASGYVGTTNVVGGLLTFDTRSPFTGLSHTIAWNDSVSETFCEGSGVAAVGGGSVTFSCGSGTVGTRHIAAPSKFTRVAVGEGTTLKASGLTFYADLRTSELEIGTNATLRLDPTESSSSHVSAIGKVTVGTNATVALRQPATPANSNNPLFLSVENFDGDINFTLYNGTTVQTLPAGWGICRVEGCYLLTNSATSGSGYSTGKTWIGITDGSWARTSNWKFQPVEGDYARFLGWPAAWGMKTSVITNDVSDNLSLGGFDIQPSAGPYIVRGKSFNIVSNDAVVSRSVFPQIFEAKFVSDRSNLLLKSMSDGRDLGAVALKGGLDAPAAALTVSGEIVLGGDVAVKEVRLIDIDRSVSFGWDKSSRAGQIVRRTALNIRSGADVKVSNQTTAHSINGSLWIAENGLLDVTGDWLWNTTACVHRVDGTLQVSGSLGGDVCQTYYGKGTIKAGTVAGATRIGRGLTLDPAAVAAKVEVAAAATLAPSASLTVDGTGSFDVGLGVIFNLKPAAGTTLMMVNPIAGDDYDLVIGGQGMTVLASEDDAGLNYLTVKAGATLSLKADHTADKLTAEAGSIVRIDLTSDDAVPELTLKQSVDLTGVTFAVADAAEEALARGKQTLLTVPALNEIRGIPDEGLRFGRLRLWVVGTADGGQALRAKCDRGMTLIVR